MARHGSSSSLEVGGKGSEEQRHTKPHCGNSTHKSNRKRETTSTLGTAVRQFSTKELVGNANSWEQLTESKVQWISFCNLFVEFVETQVLRADTIATLARDAVAIRQDSTTNPST